MTNIEPLEEFSRNAVRLLRSAVRQALREHYEAGERVVFYRQGKIYTADKPNQKGRLVASERAGDR